MRKQIILWSWVFIAVVFSLAPTGHAVAEEQDDSGKTVADHFKNEPSSDEKKGKEDQEEDILPATTSDTVWTFVKVILVLALVIALIYLLLRFINKRTRSFNDRRTIQSIGGINVGSNRSVQLVKVGGRVLVIGVGESVSLLKEIDDGEEVEQLEEESERDDVIDHSLVKFRGWLKKTQKTNGSQTDFKTMFENRLKQMSKEHKGAVEHMKRKGDDW